VRIASGRDATSDLLPRWQHASTAPEVDAGLLHIRMPSEPAASLPPDERTGLPVTIWNEVYAVMGGDLLGGTGWLGGQGKLSP
jgi:hypothetical protein